VTTPGARLGYRDVLRLPYAPGLLLAALVGRLSFATVSLAMLLAVQRSTRSYAAAGAAVGAFGLANVLVAPARARLVDRAGQLVAIPRLAAGYAALLCLLAGLTSSTTTGSWLLVTTAGAAGLFPPPLGAAMRVLWASLVDDPAMLARAYSLDAVAEELLFVTGPLLVGLTAAVAPPALGLIASAGLALAGSLAMTRSPVSIGPRPLPDKVAYRRDRPLRQPGFRPLLVALLGVGLVLGTVEIAAPAFAQQHGNAASPGLLLARCLSEAPSADCSTARSSGASPQSSGSLPSAPLSASPAPPSPSPSTCSSLVCCSPRWGCSWPPPWSPATCSPMNCRRLAQGPRPPAGSTPPATLGPPWAPPWLASSSTTSTPQRPSQPAPPRPVSVSCSPAAERTSLADPSRPTLSAHNSGSVTAHRSLAVLALVPAGAIGDGIAALDSRQTRSLDAASGADDRSGQPGGR